MSTTIGRVLSVIGVVFAAIGIFILEGISIEFPGIVLGDWATISGSATGIVPGRSWVSQRLSSA